LEESINARQRGFGVHICFRVGLRRLLLLAGEASPLLPSSSVELSLAFRGLAEKAANDAVVARGGRRSATGTHASEEVTLFEDFPPLLRRCVKLDVANVEALPLLDGLYITNALPVLGVKVILTVGATRMVEHTAAREDPCPDILEALGVIDLMGVAVDGGKDVEIFLNVATSIGRNQELALLRCGHVSFHQLVRYVVGMVLHLH